MQDTPIDSVYEITPEWLTRVLHDGGYLTHGNVVTIENRSRKSNWAHNATLRVNYSANAQGEKPTKLFIKLCNPGPDVFGNSEIVYYSIVSAGINNAPIPRCYHSAYAKESGKYHLLLEDLSDTHAPDVAPTWELVTSTISSLAQLHASWWNNPKLSLVGEFPDRNKIEKYLAVADEGLAPMLGEVGADLPQEWLTLTHKVFETHRKKMMERVGDGKDLTFIHGDLNPGNILSPVKGMDKVYLIDHQPFTWSLTTWLGVSDLSYMMVHWWDTEMRRRWEKPVLGNYHQQLIKLGIHDYSLSQLWEDYRLCAMQSIYVPAAWCVNPGERIEFKWLWWSQLQKTMAACMDLKCAELLQ